jgi:hypothetical protein
MASWGRYSTTCMLGFVVGACIDRYTVLIAYAKGELRHGNKSKEYMKMQSSGGLKFLC